MKLGGQVRGALPAVSVSDTVFGVFYRSEVLVLFQEDAGVGQLVFDLVRVHPTQAEGLEGFLATVGRSRI